MSNNSPPIEAIDADEIESSIEIEHRVYTKGASEKTKSDSDTETEDESECKSSKRSRGDDDKDGGTGQIDTSAGRKSIELGEIRKFDILIPTQRNCHGIQKGRKGLYLGFAKYRKLIDAIRPEFMEIKTPEHKQRICKWMVDKIALVGGRFLQEDEDGTSSSCRVMSLEESLKCTAHYFQHNPSWTSIALLMRESNGQSKSLLQTGPQGQKSKAPKSSPVDNANSEQNSPTTSLEKAIGLDDKIADALGPPYLKKAKLSSEIAVPPKNKSSMSTSNVDQSQSDILAKKVELFQLSHNMDKSLTKRIAIRAELTENQKILMARQERLSHLEMQFRFFMDQRFFVSPERWLTQKAIREEEILKSREFLSLQLMECKRIQSLLQVNEREVIEQERTIKLKEELLQHALDYKLLFEMGHTIRGEANDTKGIVLGNVKATESIETNNTATNNTLAEIEMKRQKQIPILKHNIPSKHVFGENLAIQAELNRRMPLKQTTGVEKELEQNFDRSTIPKEASPNVLESTDHTKKRKEKIVIDDTKKNVFPTKAKSNDDVAAPATSSSSSSSAAAATEEEDDDDFIVI